MMPAMLSQTSEQSCKWRMNIPLAWLGLWSLYRARLCLFDWKGLF